MWSSSRASVCRAKKREVPAAVACPATVMRRVSHAGRPVIALQRGDVLRTVWESAAGTGQLLQRLRRAAAGGAGAAAQAALGVAVDRRRAGGDGRRRGSGVRGDAA